MVGEQWAAVAVEAVTTEAAEAGFAFGHEELEAEFFEVGEFDFAAIGAVEFRIVGSEGEKKVFEGEGEVLGGDFAATEGVLEGLLVSWQAF